MAQKAIPLHTFGVQARAYWQALLPFNDGIAGSSRPRETEGFIAHIGIMENQMETTIIYWGYIGITEKKMETTIIAYWGYMSHNLNS